MEVGEEAVEVVDEDDRVIEVVPRREVRRRALLHRCTYVLVLDPARRLYVHRRSDLKDVDAGLLAVTAGGVNTVGETYDACAARELAEELGVAARPTFRFRHRYEGPSGRCWGAVYDVEWSGPIVRQPEEVVWGDFLAIEDADAMIGRERFCADGLEVLARWRAWDGVRTAVPSDSAWVTDLVRQSFEHYVERIGKVPAPMLRDHGEAIERSRTYVLDGDDGLIVLVPKDDHLLVRDVAVRPSEQGKGLGTRLMRFAELRAAELGLGELRLYTNQAMWENIRFYSRLGYRETERFEEAGYRRVWFRKVLAGRVEAPARPRPDPST